MQPMLFTASFTREDDLAAFEYEVIITPADGGLAWVARVTSDGTFRGRTTGLLTDMGDSDVESLELAVRDLVETSIRDRAGIS